MLVHFGLLKCRRPSDFAIQMYLIKYKQYATCILKYGNIMNIILFFNCMNINAMLCFCLAGFT